MLRKVRLIFASLCFLLVTFLFLDFTGTLHSWFGWLAKIQFLPALLAFNVSVVLFLVLITILFGRIYCSVICPLGVLQDMVARVGKMGKKLPYSYSRGLSWLRYGILTIFIIALIAGINSFVVLIAPYSSYGRIVNNLFTPFWQWGNNLLANLSERFDSYAFYEVDIWMKSIPTFIITTLTVIVIGILAWRNGRTYCNTICPVGTILGLLSRYSFIRIHIDKNKCNNCSICSRNCKAACINHKEFTVDNSRCVVCGNCIHKCKRDALSYKLCFGNGKDTANDVEEKTVNQTEEHNDARRAFLSGIALYATTSLIKAQEKGDGGLAIILDKKIPKRNSPIIPAGSLNSRNFSKRCTACQLCISVCPNQVLRPSGDFSKFMQPEVSYERGYCRPECVKCAEVCPAGAIQKITTADKSSIQIGHAVWIKNNCVVLSDNVKCGNCARHCPANAILMVPSDPNNDNSLQIPVVNTEHCIGCGACENLCPSRPYSAIYVEGQDRHRII